MKYYHESVLKKEVSDFLRIKRGELYIDATLGGAGHTKAILQKGGKVLAIDRDPASTKYVQSLKLENLQVVNANFSHIYKIAKKFGFTNVSGILFDLGLSSHQLEDVKRGFSFKQEGDLDMRMDPNLAISAKDIVNNFEKRRLHEIFQNFSDERLSWPIADAISSARKIKPIETTKELAEIIHEVYRKKRLKNRGSRAKYRVIKTDPATKVFQALRIVVNSELINLEEAFPQAEKLLKGGGRLVIISFHSLEDAIVKRFFKSSKKLKILTQSPIGPSEQELAANPRSRSAKLRAAQKL